MEDQQRDTRHGLLAVVVAAIAALLLLVTSCGNIAGMESTPLYAASKVPSVDNVRNIIRVPMTRQATDYTCGVASLQSVLGYYGEDIREDKLAENLKADPQKGVDYRNMATFARSKGFQVREKRGMALDDLKKAIDDKKPVIVCLQAWANKPTDYPNDWEDGHYVVAIGYDKDTISFMDPSTLGHYTYIRNQEFLNRWHDQSGGERLEHFGMVISKDHPDYNPNAIKPLE